MKLAGHGKKVLSLVLAAAMTVSLGTTAWADDSTPTADSQTETQQEQTVEEVPEQEVTPAKEEQNVGSEASLEDNASSLPSEEEKEDEDSSTSDSKEQKNANSSVSEEETKENTEELIDTDQLEATTFAVEDESASTKGNVSSPVRIDEQEYESLSAALAVVGTEPVAIDFTGDVYEENQIKFDGNKQVTLNLNGHTLHATRGAGSSGTETSGMQLINGCKVTIKNGTLTSDVALSGWMIKNYCDLTMDNVTVDAGNFAEGGINHCGAVLTLNNCTMTNVKNGKYAVQCGNYHTDDTVTIIDGGTYSGVANETGYWNSDGGNVKNDIKTTIRNATVDKIGTVPYTPFYDQSVMTVESTAKVGSVEGYTARVETEGAVHYYSSLESAFAAAADGQTITLLAEADDVGKLVLSDGRTITVNLNGHDVAFQQYGHFEVRHGTLNLEGAGTAYEKLPFFAPVMLYGTTADEENYSVVNVGKDVTLRGWSSVFVDKNGNYANGVVANVAGTLQSVKDNTDAYGHAVYVQGLITNVDETYAPQIHLLSTARIEAVDEEDSTKGSNGMYLAGYAVTTIDKGASIQSGAAGIEIRAGKLTVNGGTIESTAIPTSITSNGNGSTTEGAALAVSQHTTDLQLEVTINGGTFRGYTALYENCVEKGNKPELVKVTVNNGNFAATNGGVNSVYADEPETMTVSGGYYTNEVNSAYIKDETLACNLLSEKYEGIYGYQVAEKTQPEVVEVEVSVAAPTVDENADIIVDANVEHQEVVDAAKEINIASASKVDVMIAAKNQATLDGHKLDSEETRENAKKELEKKNVTVDDNTEVTILVEPKLSITPMAAKASDAERSMTFDIELVYDIKATTDPNNQVLPDEQGTVNTVYLKQNVPMPKAPTMDITLGGLSAIQISKDNAKQVYIQHDHEGTLHYYKPNVTLLDQSNIYVDSVTFTNPHGFSKFTAYSDTRKAVLNVDNSTEIEVTPDMIGGNIASLSKPGYTFQGLQIEGVSGTQLVLTSDLMDTLSERYADKGQPLTATAIYTKNSSGSGSGSSGSSTTTNNNTPANTQSGPEIEYYTCPACGYHNWTATATGYKCDHCGYVESTKQLSSYGNVKGVYDPQSAAQASATSVQGTIPQTSDDMPLVGLVVVAVAALLGLGVTVVMKKRNMQ